MFECTEFWKLNKIRYLLIMLLDYNTFNLNNIFENRKRKRNKVVWIVEQLYLFNCSILNHVTQLKLKECSELFRKLLVNSDSVTKIL